MESRLSRSIPVDDPLKLAHAACNDWICLHIPVDDPLKLAHAACNDWICLQIPVDDPLKLTHADCNDWICLQILVEALSHAGAARRRVLATLSSSLDAPRQYGERESAPRFGSVMVEKDLLGRVIGPQGSNVRSIERETGARITVDDSGEVRQSDGPKSSAYAYAFDMLMRMCMLMLIHMRMLMLMRMLSLCLCLCCATLGRNAFCRKSDARYEGTPDPKRRFVTACFAGAKRLDCFYLQAESRTNCTHWLSAGVDVCAFQVELRGGHGPHHGRGRAGREGWQPLPRQGGLHQGA
eukprot:7452398-Pyramimonas_sp.AAC.1